MFPRTIKKRKTFLEASQNGSCVKSKTVLVICNKKGADDLLVGFTASKKIGKAVIRNFAKRRLRHLVREFYLDFGTGYDFVFIATRSTVSSPFSKLRSDFVASFKKARALEDSRVK